MLFVVILIGVPGRGGGADRAGGGGGRGREGRPRPMMEHMRIDKYESSYFQCW